LALITSNAWVPIEPVEPSSSTPWVVIASTLSTEDTSTEDTSTEDTSTEDAALARSCAHDGHRVSTTIRLEASVAGTGQELARRNGRPPATGGSRGRPSVAWGWHGGFARHGHRRLVSVVALLLMTIGNHEGHIEDIYLVGTAIVIAYALVRQHRKQKHSWRR